LTAAWQGIAQIPHAYSERHIAGFRMVELMRFDWNDAPCTFVFAVVCPFCRAPRPITVRSEQKGDQSVTQKSICRQCSRRFKIVIESLPDFGNHDSASG
jgi:hypothetical protein